MNFGIMKKTGIAMVIGCFMVICLNISYAHDYIGVSLVNEKSSEGETVDLSQREHMTLKDFYSLGHLMIEKNDKLYFSLNDLFALQEYEIHTYDESGIVYVDKGEQSYVFLTELNYYYDNDDKIKMKDSVIVEEQEEKEKRYYAPLEVLSTIFDLDYKVLPEINAVVLPEEFLNHYKKINITKDEIIHLSRLLFFEARDGSIHKKTAVANVVLNRVKSPHFPNTIDGVIFERGQFPPSKYRKFATLVPPKNCVKAVMRALNGVNVCEECLYFNMIPFPNKEADFYKKIEGDYFYY